MFLLGLGALFFLWSSDASAETFCLPHEHEESYWVTVGGVTTYNFQSWNSPPRSSFDLDRRVEIELPTEMCWSVLMPWMEDMRDAWYLESCQWDVNGDKAIGLDDLATIMTAVMGQLGQSCEDIH